MNYFSFSFSSVLLPICGGLLLRLFYFHLSFFHFSLYPLLLSILLPLHSDIIIIIIIIIVIIIIVAIIICISTFLFSFLIHLCYSSSSFFLLLLLLFLYYFLPNTHLTFHKLLHNPHCCNITHYQNIFLSIVQTY